jgi:hypothetical protein
MFALIAVSVSAHPVIYDKTKTVLGTLDSPEWRKGPSGPKTLCNACGLRWAKKEKKKNNTGSAGAAQNGPSASLVEP